MVKIFFLILFLFSSLHAQDLLIKKIQNLVSPKTFAKDRAFIETIFSQRVSSITVMEQLTQLKL